MEQDFIPVIDTHVHFWKYDRIRDEWITNDMKVLQEDYLPTILEPTLKRNGVNGCVAVQASQEEVETHFLVEMARKYSFIKGVVGWVDLRADNLKDRLHYFSQYPEIKGWRHVVQGEPAGFLLQENFIRGVKELEAFNYTYDILVYHHQLNDVIPFLNSLGNQKLIIDHAAKPDIANKKIDEWAASMKTIAAHPNVYCKLSGLFTEAEWKKWSAADFYPYLDVLFNAFGPGRLLYGSDWPVILLSGMYVQWKSLLEKYMEHFSQDERDNVMGRNAISFYNL